MYSALRIAKSYKSFDREEYRKKCLMGGEGVEEQIDSDVCFSIPKLSSITSSTNDNDVFPAHQLHRKDRNYKHKHQTWMLDAECQLQKGPAAVCELQ
jgi:hypothetical protein